VVWVSGDNIIMIGMCLWSWRWLYNLFLMIDGVIFYFIVLWTALLPSLFKCRYWIPLRAKLLFLQLLSRKWASYLPVHLCLFMQHFSHVLFWERRNIVLFWEAKCRTLPQYSWKSNLLWCYVYRLKVWVRYHKWRFIKLFQQTLIQLERFLLVQLLVVSCG